MEFRVGISRDPEGLWRDSSKWKGEAGSTESDLALAWRSEGRSMAADYHSDPSTLGKRVSLWRGRRSPSHMAMDPK